MSSGPGEAAADRRWMEQALALGSLAEGRTSPNPRVGCLLVRDGRLVGSGYHRAYGEAHAEAIAVERAGPQARGATVYVNLEPCAHHGRTPPCADLLVRAGVRRVVAALQDPNPRVDGRGFAALRDAGIEVAVGLLADAASRLNEAFCHSHRFGRPLVTLKAASSLDGMIAAAGGASQWITGPPARRFAHRLRLRHDAVLVGARTVRRDDPRLTVRLPGVARRIVRAVLAPGLDLDPRSSLFGEADHPRPRVYATVRAASGEAARSLRGKADVIGVPDVDGALDLDCVLADLHDQSVQSVLVEGGARTIGGFLDAGLAQHVALFFSNTLLGARGGTPLVDRPSVRAPAAGWRLDEIRQIALAGDALLLARLVPPASG